MAKVVVIGAGISGHTAALFLRKKLSKDHKVCVITPNSNWNWVPSNIWVGVGIMKKEQVTFPLLPIYKKKKIEYIQGAVTTFHPEGGLEDDSPYVLVEMKEKGCQGQLRKVHYDYLINATGPKLKFEATEGLGPDHHSMSVCTPSHAEESASKLAESIERMKKGEKQTFVIGAGHGSATCQGAAFEYSFNVEFEINRYQVRDKARIIYLTNEAQLGDFGVGGLHIKRGGYVTHSRTFAESLYAERGVEWITGAHVQQVENGQLGYETLTDEEHSLKFDFAMLIPPFSGHGFKAYDKNNEDITSQLFADNGFMKVDAVYGKTDFQQWKPSDWPKVYQNQTFKNLYAIGIAFAPPHAISVPRTNRKGTLIAPAPPRTGMPSAIIGRQVALSLANIINGRSDSPTHTASLSDLGAACVASAGAGFLEGTAASLTMYPIIPDYEKYPHYGRDLNHTFGEIGTAGHWIKQILHYMFIYKAKARPGWSLIPE